MTHWCILRTSHGSTITLANALEEAGYRVWTPVETKTRDEIRREKNAEAVPLPGGKGQVPITVPMVSTFVFADRDRLMDLIALERSPEQTWQHWDADQKRFVTKGIPRFTLFRYLGEYPTIPDRALDPLRGKERQRKPRGLVKAYKVGDAVKLAEGGFAGLSGTVEAVKNKTEVVVAFPGYPLSATFPAWVLLDAQPEINVNGKKSEWVGS